MSALIGYVEDDPIEAQWVVQSLQNAGFHVKHWTTGQAFLQECASFQELALLVFDWHLPDATGIELVKTIRGRSVEIPVLFITQRDGEEDIVAALGAGADDFMTKPVKPLECVARLQALLRRSQSASQNDVVECGPYKFSRSSREAFVNGQAVELTNKDFDLAVFMFRHVDQLLSRKAILERVWGIAGDINTRTIDVHMSRLRKSLDIREEHGFRIKTIYQHGYRLERVLNDDSLTQQPSGIS